MAYSTTATRAVIPVKAGIRCAERSILEDFPDTSVRAVDRGFRRDDKVEARRSMAKSSALFRY
jgi:hypothetical protein